MRYFSKFLPKLTFFENFYRKIQHFQSLTLKIQNQCHTWRPHSRYNTLSTHITFVRCRWALALLSISIEKIDLEKPRSRSWLRWTLKVTTWVQHSIDSHSFCSMSICRPIPEIRLFKIWPWKIQILILVKKKFKNLDFCQNFRKSWFLSKFSKSLDFGRNVRQISVLFDFFAKS